MAVAQHPSFTAAARDYARVERAIAYLAAHQGRQPSLREVAAAVGLSEFHFHRLFVRWAGVSPKRFLQALTRQRAKALLGEAQSVLSATLGAGLSSPGRLHDLFVECEAVTPGEYKRRGAGIDIRYGFHATPFGAALVGITDRGVCHLAFSDGDVDRAHHALAAAWPRARLIRSSRETRAVIEQIFVHSPRPLPFHLLLRGTNFQIKVWEALLAIPPGTVCSYEAVAQLLGLKRSQRAVAQAIAHNPIAWLIPCHRVIQKSGALGGYRWGEDRKRALLAWEAIAAYPATADD